MSPSKKTAVQRGTVFLRNRQPHDENGGDLSLLPMNTLILPGNLDDEDRTLLEKVEAGFETGGELYNACKFRAALGEAMALARAANMFLDRQAKKTRDLCFYGAPFLSVLASSADNCLTDSSGTPRSRILFRMPCSAAWSITGPVSTVSPPGPWTISHPSNIRAR
jgi:hypothetical protein